jgi:hypothetical protein
VGSAALDVALKLVNGSSAMFTWNAGNSRVRDAEWRTGLPADRNVQPKRHS